MINIVSVLLKKRGCLKSSF